MTQQFDHLQSIIFKPGAGAKPWRKGQFLRMVESRDPEPIAEVILSGDAFSVCVYLKQLVSANQSPIETVEVSDMPKMTAKELRREAKNRGLEDWDTMSLADLRAAVEGSAEDAPAKPAKRALKVVEPEPEDDDEADYDDEGADDEEPYEDEAEPEDDADFEDEPAPKPVKPTKKAAAKADPKKAAPKVDDTVLDESGNPFKPGTNMYHIAAELLKGGSRAGMVARLKNKIDLRPRNASDEYNEDAELDRRIAIISQTMKNKHGFTIDKQGRGREATIQAVK